MGPTVCTPPQQRQDEDIPSAPAQRWSSLKMEQLFYRTLSFDDLEVLVLVEDGGATPREVDEALGMGRRETVAVFRHLLRRGLLDWEGRGGAPGTEPSARSFFTTPFHLTPLAHCLRQDEAFNLKAFGASLGVVDDDGLD